MLAMPALSAPSIDIAARNKVSVYEDTPFCLFAPKNAPPYRMCGLISQALQERSCGTPTPKRTRDAAGCSPSLSHPFMSSAGAESRRATRALLGNSKRDVSGCSRGENGGVASRWESDVEGATAAPNVWRSPPRTARVTADRKGMLSPTRCSKAQSGYRCKYNKQVRRPSRRELELSSTYLAAAIGCPCSAMSGEQSDGNAAGWAALDGIQQRSSDLQSLGSVVREGVALGRIRFGELGLNV